MAKKKPDATEEKTKLIMEALEEKKAVDPAEIVVRGRTTMADRFIFATGTSRIHVKALVDGVIDKLRDNGFKGKRVEGEVQADWVLLDYGDVVVHVMSPEQRAFYHLEAYWSGEEKGSPPPLSPDEV